MGVGGEAMFDKSVGWQAWHFLRESPVVAQHRVFWIVCLGDLWFEHRDKKCLY